MKSKIVFLAIAFVAMFGMQAAAQHHVKVGYVDSDSVLTSLPEYQTKMKDLETYEAQLAAELQKMQADFQTKYQDFQANEKNWPDVILEQKYRELEQLQQSIQTFQQNAQQSFVKKEQEVMTPLVEKVQKGIDAVAKEHGYTHILQKQLFLYAAPEYDITALVINKLKQ